MTRRHRVTSVVHAERTVKPFNFSGGGVIASQGSSQIWRLGVSRSLRLLSCRVMDYNQEVRWNHRLVKIFVYNKHVVESAQLVKIWMNFYGVSPKCWVTCFLMTRIIASWKISTLILVCQVFTLRTEIRKKTKKYLNWSLGRISRLIVSKRPFIFLLTLDSVKSFPWIIVKIEMNEDVIFIRIKRFHVRCASKVQNIGVSSFSFL